jgi:hypothetical protein
MEKNETSRHIRSSVLTGLLIAVLLAALPVAVWMDLTNLAEAALRRQASDLNSVISSVRTPPMSSDGFWPILVLPR